MPGKNKPKRLDRNRAWRVARRKKRIAKLVNGNSRNRAPRPKNKGRALIDKIEKVVEDVKKEAKKGVLAVEKSVKDAVKNISKKKE